MSKRLHPAWARRPLCQLVFLWERLAPQAIPACHLYASGFASRRSRGLTSLLCSRSSSLFGYLTMRTQHSVADFVVLDPGRPIICVSWPAELVSTRSRNCVSLVSGAAGHLRHGAAVVLDLPVLGTIFSARHPTEGAPWRHGAIRLAIQALSLDRNPNRFNFTLLKQAILDAKLSAFVRLILIGASSFRHLYGVNGTSGWSTTSLRGHMGCRISSISRVPPPLPRFLRDSPSSSSADRPAGGEDRHRSWLGSCSA